MRKQIAAANWKMNLTWQQGKQLLEEILAADISLRKDQLAIFGVPAPYLGLAEGIVSPRPQYAIAAQNCYDKKSGAFTGEIAAGMLQSIGINYCIIGHSERREYFGESNQMLAEKLDRCLENSVVPIFCCGEALQVREAGTQNEFVEKQLEESLFHLTAEQLKSVVIAYEPIWAIGTGKTASTDQAQEMHACVREVLARKYSAAVASEISILYGGSVKAGNAKDLFGCPDVDGGLVGGASLVASDFIAIIRALK